MYVFNGKGSYQLSQPSTIKFNCEEMTDLKSIKLSSFTFDIMLNYCFFSGLYVDNVTKPVKNTL